MKRQTIQSIAGYGLPQQRFKTSSDTLGRQAEKSLSERQGSPLNVPGCPLSVSELFSDGQASGVALPNPFGDDVDAHIYQEDSGGEVRLGLRELPPEREGLPTPKPIPPQGAHVLVDAPPPPEPAPSQGRHFDGAAAIRKGLQTQGRPFNELLPGMRLVDMLEVASTQAWSHTKAYAIKAADLYQAGHFNAAKGFTLLFLVGRMTLRSALANGCDPCRYLSHEDIQGLDKDSRDVLERRWRTAPDGPLRALVMGSGAAPRLSVEAVSVPSLPGRASDLQGSSRRDHALILPLSGADDPQPRVWPDVFTTLKTLVQQGVITAKYSVPLINESRSLSDLKQRAYEASNHEAGCLVAEAATLYKQGELRAARYLGLVVLMTGRVPPAQGLKGCRLNQLISHSEATSLCQQFDLDLDLQQLL